MGDAGDACIGATEKMPTGDAPVTNHFIGLYNVFQPLTFMTLVIGVFGGIVIGALPGLTSTMAIALLLPVTYGMDANVGIVMLLGVYCGAIYGGCISAIMLNTPGTPASAATTLDGYPMAQRGEAGRALSIATVASTMGGVISGILLILVAPILARFALQFGPTEFFALAVFGLSIIVGISNKSIAKGLSAGFLGLIFASVGIDNVSGVVRFTFGVNNLLNGFQLVPAMIGLFAVSQVLLSMEIGETNQVVRQEAKRLLPTKADFIKILPTAIRGSLIGTFIGAVPGTGGDIAAFVSYNTAQRISKTPEEFGTGSIIGVAAPESANNGTTGGTLIPLLTLGVPGDSSTAVLLGAFTLKGLQAGPLLFTRHAELVNTIFSGFMVANALMLLLGLGLMRVYIKTLSAKNYFIIPGILLLCVVGAFAINKNYFDIIVMFGFGFIGYIFTKLKIPLSPIILAFILGPLAETNMRRALMVSKGNPSVFFTRPITVILLVVAILSIVIPIIRNAIARRRGGVVGDSGAMD